MNGINTDTIRYIIAFLAENEQYGDDWGEEIAELRHHGKLYHHS